VTDNARPLLELERKFFNEKRAGNGSYTFDLSEFRTDRILAVPVIAIFTKFDDLISQVYDMDLEEEENCQAALQALENKFRKPLDEYDYPPRAYVRFEGMFRLISALNLDLKARLSIGIHEDKGNHQDQVKNLIENTASSLDTPALRMLFVSVQQNNMELCIEYAIRQYAFFDVLFNLMIYLCLSADLPSKHNEVYYMCNVLLCSPDSAVKATGSKRGRGVVQALLRE